MDEYSKEEKKEPKPEPSRLKKLLLEKNTLADLMLIQEILKKPQF